MAVATSSSSENTTGRGRPRELAKPETRVLQRRDAAHARKSPGEAASIGPRAYISYLSFELQINRALRNAGRCAANPRGTARHFTVPFPFFREEPRLFRHSRKCAGTAKSGEVSLLDVSVFSLARSSRVQRRRLVTCLRLHCSLISNFLVRVTLAQSFLQK